MSLERTQLADPWWRLNNLYFIKDKTGKKIRLKLNWAQETLYREMWYLSLILKARQLGITTEIQIFMLDRCLFNDNQNAGVIAHNKEDAEVFFNDKIKFAYDNLPQDLRNLRKATSDTARSMRFSNGSMIRVGTSMRSGTYQYLHVSEFGKMCAKYPEKAQEVITGTLNTIAAGQIAFIESTAEGPFGEFYDMCRTAEDLTMAVNNGQTNFTALDWKFFFFPWFRHPDYVLHEKVEIPDKLRVYFQELRTKHKIDLRPEQQYWYAKKAAEQRDKMKQEYPSTPAEAFERSTELAIYGKQLRRAREQKRITKLPIVRGIPVNSYWDLGRNDVTAIWFHQHIEARHHFIYYTEGRLEDLTYYVELLRELKQEYKWYYGSHYLPHDVEVTDISAFENKSRRRILEEAGLNPIRVVPKVRNILDGIELTRRVFDECWFDEEGCEIGLRALAGYEWLYDELHQTTRKTPAHNWASNGADSFRQFAQGYKGVGQSWKEQARLAGDKTAASGRKYAQKRRRKGTLINPTLEHVV